MALTNREIINNQVKRISKKVGMNLEAHFTPLFCYLYLRGEDGTLQSSPFDPDNTMRRCSQMIEYLAGLEDAINCYTRSKTVGD